MAGNMGIQTNTGAMRAHNALRTVNVQQERASRRMTSGHRINSAADDVAGMGISEKMRSQIHGIEMATRNANDAISLIQTAEGGMQGIHDLVHRMRELMVYAANDTHTVESRQSIQIEIESLVHELDMMTHRVQFSTRNLLRGADGGPSPMSMMIGASDLLPFSAAVASAENDFVSSYVALSPAQAKADKASSAVAVARFNVMEMFNSFLRSEALEALASAGGQIGALANELQGFVGNAVSAIKDMGTKADWDVGGDLPSILKGVTALDMPTFKSSDPEHRAGFEAIKSMFENMSAVNRAFGESLQVRDTSLQELEQTQYLLNELEAQFRESLENYAAAPLPTPKFEAVSPTSANADEREALRLWFHVGPNHGHGVILEIDPIDSQRLRIGDGRGNLAADLNVARERGEEISRMLDRFDYALAHVSAQRSKLGAMQNRLEHVVESLGVTFENLSSARSRIQDADMAKEVMNSARANVLAQAAMSMLAQANQAPMAVMQLLQQQ